MAKFSAPITNFTAGEISPKAFGRVDLDVYKNACETLENMLVHPQGGASRRPGTIYEATTYNSQQARAIPFQISKAEAYVLEITPVVGPATRGLTLTNVNTGVVFDLENDYGSGDSFSSDGFPVGFVYTAAQFDAIQYAQIGDRLYLFHPDVPPMVIIHLGEDLFEYRMFYYFRSSETNLNKWQTFPFLDTNIDTTLTITPSVTTGTGTATASSALFDAGHVGAIFRIGSGYFVVTSFSSATSVGIKVLSTLAATTANDDWQECAWSDYRGWPTAATFYQQRIVYSKEITLYGSQIGNLINLRQTEEVIDTGSNRVYDQSSSSYFPESVPAYDQEDNPDPFIFNLWTSFRANSIQWLTVFKNLAFGTCEEEVIADGQDPSLAVGVFNVPDFTGDTFYGSESHQPAHMNNALAFIQTGGKMIREFQFSFEYQSYKANDLSVLGEHMYRRRALELSTFVNPKFKHIEWDATRKILWCLDNNGGLTSITRDVENGIAAWSAHRLGGSNSSDPAYVESMAIVKNSDGLNEVWLVVKRFINGSTVYYKERIASDYIYSSLYNSSSSVDDKPIYMDCARLAQLPAAISAASSAGLVTEGTDTINIANSFWNGLIVKYTTDDTAITGLTNNSNYFVVNVGSGTFKLSSTLDGTAIDLTDDGVGNHTFTPQASAVWEAGFGAFRFQHLEGETVDVIADGLYYGQVVVTSGRITLSANYSEVIAGLPFTHKLQTVPLEAGSRTGTSQGTIKRIDKVVARLFSTCALSIGNSSTSLEEINFEGDDMSVPIVPFTGWKDVDLQQTYDRDSQVYIEGSVPLPCHIVGLFATGMTYD